jgi:monoterpene epsilon-lactone hydrolase
MSDRPTRAPFTLHGRWQYRWRSVMTLWWSTVFITVRRLLRGPRFSNWSWGFETVLHFMKAQAATAFALPDLTDGREYEDALVFASPAVDQVCIEPVAGAIKGDWFRPKSQTRNVTVLYLHGGGYVHYAQHTHQNLIALVALATEAQTFALDYRLAPEHPFPAPLDDALAAYRWLLATGVAPERLVIAGDSAGGHLTLALLLALREARLPLPAASICLCPWTDLANSGESMTTNAPYDWIDQQMTAQWSAWFCQDADFRHPLISPTQADLQGLPPLYLQAGSAEILHDMIEAFAEHARQQGASVELEVWPNMVHDFQAFGTMLPESQAALARIGEVIKNYVPSTPVPEKIA